MSRHLALLAVALPVLGLALGIARSEHRLGQGQSWTFAVEGYDPRDLLKGRYLRYRLKLDQESPMEDCESDERGQCCLCLTRTAQGQPPRTRLATCETARAQCDDALDRSYLSDLRRYYIPEASASSLEKRFIDAAGRDQAHLVVKIGRDGRPHVDHLRLDGERVE